MARSVDTIFQGMLQYVAGSTALSALLSTTITTEQELLDKLSSTSRVAIWVQLFHVVAININTFEQLMDTFRNEIDETIANNVYGTERWWVTKMKEFQYGDTLTFVNDQPGYATVTPANRIITASACVPSTGGVITLKTAKTSGGALTSLSGAELTAAQAFADLITPAGVYPTVTTAAADELKVTATVYIDPQVINLTDGSLISDSSVYPVEDAINAYLSTFSTVNFNGQINLSHLKDAVQDVSGVNDFVISNAEADAGSGYNAIGRLYTASSGYIIEGTGSGNTFSDTLSYVSGN